MHQRGHVPWLDVYISAHRWGPVQAFPAQMQCCGYHMWRVEGMGLLLVTTVSVLEPSLVL
jgi:hypothetical protein